MTKTEVFISVLDGENHDLTNLLESLGIKKMPLKKIQMMNALFGDKDLFTNKHSLYKVASTFLTALPNSKLHTTANVTFLDPAIVTNICFSNADNGGKPHFGLIPSHMKLNTLDQTGYNRAQPHILTDAESNAGMKWYGYNAYFKWRYYTDLEFSTIPKEHIMDARERAGSHVKIGGGHPYQETAGGRGYVPKLLETWSYGIQGTFFPRIKPKFRFNKENGGCCVWLSACMLVNTFDSLLADNMIQYMKNNKEKVRWMTLFGKRNRKNFYGGAVRSGERILAKELPKFHLLLNHVSFSNNVDTHEKLLTNYGLYVCIISTYPCYTQSHAIGVQCDTESRLIWDGVERRAMEYTIQNLHLCCPQLKVCPTEEQFIKISFIGQIIRIGNIRRKRRRFRK